MSTVSPDDLLRIIGELYVRNVALQREVAMLKAALVQEQESEEPSEG